MDTHEVSAFLRDLESIGRSKMSGALVLVVDDNENNRDILSRRLKRQKYSVAVAENGLEALEIVERQKFDLIILDIMMPGISGLEVLRRLRKTYSVADLPIIIATARDQSEDIVTALELGANDYITKPLDFPVALARIQTQLEVKQLSELKDEFIRMASHDLKNPLAIVLGLVRIIEKRVPPGQVMTSDAHELLSKITKRALEMQGIIEDFLDFHALQDGRLSLVKVRTNLNEIAQEVVESNRDYANAKGIHLSLNMDAELPHANADADRVMQVVRNLISNALKFSPHGSAATVTTRSEDSHVVLEVSDTGPGLTTEDLDKVFTKYARLSNKPTGGEKSSGLGLAICKQMIDLHGGEIGVRNNPEKGSSFWFKLPV